MLLHPDPDAPQLQLLDPTQYRYELIRPLLLCPERTATQRAQETGTHPETVGRLKRRFDQQGMLGLVPATLDVLPARRQLRFLLCCRGCQVSFTRSFLPSLLFLQCSVIWKPVAY